MFRKYLAVSIGAAALAASPIALATGPAHPANTETGTVYHGAEYSTVDGRVVRVDKWNSPGASPIGSANDAWEYLGEGSGWMLRQHSYEFQNGRFVHSDTIPHDTLKPTLGSEHPDRSPGS